MIDAVDNDAEYYYHYDGLGSVVALSDSAGDTVQTYGYSVYGQVAASDPDFLTNPYMFTGRRFDFETGLYYYRARYYNPYIGRFLQTDPVGYGDGINWYLYCANNPVGMVDPSGLFYTFLDTDHEDADKDKLTWAWMDYDGDVKVIGYYDNIDAWCNASEKERFTYGVDKGVYGVDRRSIGKELSKRLVREKTIGDVKYDQNWLYERLQFLEYLGCGNVISTTEEYMKKNNLTVNITFNTGNPKEVFGGYNGYTTKNYSHINVYWHPTWDGIEPLKAPGNIPSPFPPLVGLVHELSHAADFVYKDAGVVSPNTEGMAYAAENVARFLFRNNVPGWENLVLRPLP